MHNPFLETDILVVTSPKLLDELRWALTYEHLPFSEDDVNDIPHAFLFLTNAEVVEPEDSFDVLDDPEDNKILDCEVEAEADYLVSGDEKHVQPLDEFRGVSIISPDEFLEETGEAQY